MKLTNCSIRPSHHRSWWWPMPSSLPLFMSLLLLMVTTQATNASPTILPLQSSAAPLLATNLAFGRRRNSNKTKVLATTTNKQSSSLKEAEEIIPKESVLGFANLDLTGIIVLALGTGMSYKLWDHIPKRHFAFAIVYPLYLGTINRIRFQRNRATREQAVRDPRRVMAVRSLLFQDKGIWFVIYVHVFAVIGLLLPLILCLAGPSFIAAPAASHTMLLFAQVLMEMISSGPFMHAQAKLMVPIGFNTYRMATLWTWVTRSWEIGQRTLQQQQSSSSPIAWSTKVWVSFAVLMGVVNLVVWSYNLFIFLFLRVVPQYWDAVTFPTNTVRWRGQLVPVAAMDQ